MKVCKDGVLCNPNNILNTTLSISQSNIDNSNSETCGKYHDYSPLITETAEVIYVGAQSPPTRVSKGEIKTSCEIGTQTCEFL